MIRRTDDYSVFADKDLSKIASAVEKAESKKLFDSFDNEIDAEIASTELRIKGYKATIERTAGKFKVVVTKQDHIALDEAEESGQFKKLAWGRYSFERQSGVGELFEYNFNDGSIWKLATDDDGNSVLVKEVDEEDEENVIRNTLQDNRQQTREAATKKKDIRYASDITVKTISKILYDTTLTDEFLHDATPDVKNSLYKMLDSKLDKLISSKLQEQNINDENDINEIKKLTATALTMEVNSKYNLTKFINSVVKERLDKVGQKRKYFK